MMPDTMDATPHPPADAPQFRRWIAAGVGVVLVSLVLMRVQPHRMGVLPSGMLTPVLALELVRTPGEVERIFGAAPEQRVAWVARMVHGTTIDFALLALYGLFLGGIASELRRGGSRAALVALGLSFFAACFDAGENWQLLTIFAHLGEKYDATVSTLRLFTSLKWSCLAGYFALIAPALWARRGFARAAAVSGVLGAVATPLALAVRGVAAELMMNALSVAIALLFVAAYRSKPEPATGGR